jgi:hypothetical protein
VIFRGVLLKDLFNRLHRKKEPGGLKRERDEVMLEIELCRPGLGVNNNGPGCNLAGTEQRPIKRVKKEKLA